MSPPPRHAQLAGTSPGWLGPQPLPPSMEFPLAPGSSRCRMFSSKPSTVTT